MKTITVVSAWLDRPDLAEAMALEESDHYPRVTLYQRYLESEILDEKFMRDRVPGWRQFLYKFVPRPLDQLLEVYLLRKEYDVVITWAERLGLPFALLLKLTGSKTHHVTLNSWISKPKKAELLKWVHSHISRLLLWSSVQRDYAVNVVKVPPEKITFIRKFADQKFWRPIQCETDMICSVGMEMRDFPTLIEAMRGLEIRCHIAAGLTRGLLYDTVAAIDRVGELPSNVTVGRREFRALRDLYARSRFVVIPLRSTDTDNGLTCMLEAMAMGKAVICSRTKGQLDVLRDGIDGLFVPQGDPGALRQAIRHLWDNPEIAVEMGRRGREYLIEHHTIEQFVESVRTVAEEVCGKTGELRPFSLFAESEANAN